MGDGGGKPLEQLQACRGDRWWWLLISSASVVRLQRSASGDEGSYQNIPTSGRNFDNLGFFFNLLQQKEPCQEIILEINHNSTSSRMTLKYNVSAHIPFSA